MNLQKKKQIEDGIRLRVQHEDDLWALAQMIRPGCKVGMMGYRRDQSTGTQESGRAISADRKPMWIVLNAESTEFQPFTDNLRIHGIIIEAAMDRVDSGDLEGYGAVAARLDDEASDPT